MLNGGGVVTSSWKGKSGSKIVGQYQGAEFSDVVYGTGRIISITKFVLANLDSETSRLLAKGAATINNSSRRSCRVRP